MAAERRPPRKPGAGIRPAKQVVANKEPREAKVLARGGSPEERVDSLPAKEDLGEKVVALVAAKVVVAKVVPEGLREMLFVNVLLFWLISKSVGAETVIAPVRFTPEIV